VAGDTLAVGAPGEVSKTIGISGNQTDDSAMNSGAVYVFRRKETTWTQQPYVKSSNTEKATSSVGSWRFQVTR
jgi:hypothetical protein